MERIYQKLILIKNEKEAKKHGYTGYDRISGESCAVFVDEETEMCDYDRFKNITVFAIHPKEHEIVFYGVDDELKSLIDDALVRLNSVKY